VQVYSISEITKPLITTHSKREEAVNIISRILLEVNPPDAIPTRPPPEMKFKITQQTQAVFQPPPIIPLTFSESTW
jgi:hypothetical protein